LLPSLSCSEHKYITNKPSPLFSFSASTSKAPKAAFIGIGVVGLVILLVILVAVCWPHNSPVLKDVSVNKPGDASFWFPICCSNKKNKKNNGYFVTVNVSHIGSFKSFCPKQFSFLPPELRIQLR
jgi:hypothetical protein